MDSFRKCVSSSVRGGTPRLPKGQLLAIDLWFDQLPRSTQYKVCQKQQQQQQHCNKGEDFRYLYITTQITHTYTDTCVSKGGTLGGQHRLWARFTQLEPPPRQSPSSASQGSCQGKQKQSRQGLTFLSARARAFLTTPCVTTGAATTNATPRLWQLAFRHGARAR